MRRIDKYLIGGMIFSAIMKLATTLAVQQQSGIVDYSIIFSLTYLMGLFTIAVIMGSILGGMLYLIFGRWKKRVLMRNL